MLVVALFGYAWALLGDAIVMSPSADAARSATVSYVEGHGYPTALVTDESARPIGRWTFWVDTVGPESPPSTKVVTVHWAVLPWPHYDISMK